MKKLFFGVVLLALLASCNQNETVSQPEANYISFSNAFIDKATRADNSTTTDNFGLFEVYGHYETLSAVFNKVEVKKTGGTWSYGTAKAWEEGEHYYFHAIAPVGTITLSPYPSTTTTKGIPVFSYKNTTADKDLIYAFAEREQPLKVDAPLDLSPVDFTFDHLLSRVKFTFENQITTGKDIEILDVTILEVASQGSIDLNVDPTNWKWNLQPATVGYNGGKTTSIAQGAKKVADNVLFVLPAPAKTYKVQFSIRYDGNDYFINNAEVKDVEFQMGYSYNFTAKVTDAHVSPLAENIEFTVTGVTGWPMDGSKDVTF